MGEVEESGGVGTGNLVRFSFFDVSKSHIIGGGLMDNLVGLATTVIGNECGMRKGISK